MKYKYTGLNEAFIYGLPARDLDDQELDAGQLNLLQAGVNSGLYIPDKVIEINTKKDKATRNDTESP